MKIPKQLQNSIFRFILLKKKEKRPIELEWQTKNNYKFNDPKLIKHINSGGNYGIIGGGKNHLVIIDFDNKEVQEKVIQNLPKTFTIKTGSGLLHKYFFSDDSKSFKIFNEELETLADIQGEGKQVVGGGSIHPNGKKYEIVDNTEIAFLSYSEIKANLMIYDKKPKKEREKEPKNKLKDYENNTFIDELKARIKIRDVLNKLGINTSKNPTECPLHSSKGGKCLGFKEETAHCFHCDGSWNIFSLVMDVKKCDFKESLIILSDWFGMQKEFEDSKKEYKNNNNGLRVFTIPGQVQSFWQKNPFFYDKGKLFWLWNASKFKYEKSDETDVLNGISDLGINVINSKTKTEILNGLRQYGRRKIPKKTPSSWIQFRENIVDFKTGKKLKASPEYFVTNPIPWDIGDSEKTPIMDKFILEWVGEKYIKTLYEIIAYCCSNEQFMQNMIALVGGGANGKGTFLKLLTKFLGDENFVSSDLKELSVNQFETASIYRKLLCILGEVSYDDLRNTNQIKKLSGEDSIRYCFKGKIPFTEKSITTLIIATNSLPKTPDKTLGFYRRWLIIDFKNQFQIKTGILEAIPEQEYKNLAKKILRILKELYLKQEFHEQGTYEEKMEKYEARSNPVMNFIENFCEETLQENLELREFTNHFNSFAKKNHIRLVSVRQVGKILREEGFEVGKRKIFIDENPISKVLILNLGFRTTKTTKTTKGLSQNTWGVSSESHGSFGSSGIQKDNTKTTEKTNPNSKKVSDVPTKPSKNNPTNLTKRDTRDTFSKKENTHIQKEMDFSNLKMGEILE